MVRKSLVPGKVERAGAVIFRGPMCNPENESQIIESSQFRERSLILSSIGFVKLGLPGQ